MLSSYLIPELPEALSKERNLGPGNTGTGMGSSGTGITPGATSQGGGPIIGGGMGGWSNSLASLLDTGKRGLTGGLIGK